MRFRFYVIKLFCCLLFAKIGASQTSILFIGNSLTYVNDLPATFKEVCDSCRKKMEVKMVAYPGFSLKDHLTSVIVPSKNPNMVFKKRVEANDSIVPEAIKLLRLRKWDYIYLQDREAMEDSICFALKQIRSMAPGSKIFIFENYMDDSRWSESYDRKKKRKNSKVFKQYAAFINAVVVPAGSIFEKIRSEYPKEMLYDEAMHPTKLGTVIISLILFDKIYGNAWRVVDLNIFNLKDEDLNALRFFCKKYL